MKNKFLIICLIITFFASISDAGDETASKSTVEDQIEVQVAVYNNNIGLIKDTRKIILPSGEGELRFM